jgi:hypothetical protein
MVEQLSNTTRETVVVGVDHGTPSGRTVVDRIAATRPVPGGRKVS